MRDLRLAGSPEPSRPEPSRPEPSRREAPRLPHLPPQPPQPPMPLLRTAVGEVLRRLRLDQSRTLADVAREAKVSMPYLSELERGRKEASSEVLAALCTALGIGLSDLIELVGRDLAAERERGAPVFRLDRAAGGYPRRPGAGRGPGDVQCLLAA